MIKLADWRKKRYQFRLTADDKDIFDFVSKSKGTESETIRKLLKFAVSEIEKERENRKHIDLLQNIISELHDIKIKQQDNHSKVMDRLDLGIVIENEKQDQLKNTEDEVTRSVENSIDSMIDSFGVE